VALVVSPARIDDRTWRVLYPRKLKVGFLAKCALLILLFA